MERRTLPSETENDIEREMDSLLRRCSGEGIEADGRLVSFRQGTEIAPDEQVVRSLLEGATREGINLNIGGMAAWPEAGVLNRSGIPSVVFGPSGCRGHEPMEFVSIDSVVACSRIVHAMTLDFFGNQAGSEKD